MKKDNVEFITRSIKLTAEQWAALELHAQRRGSLAPTGPRAGKPSWRTLIKEIANELIFNNNFQKTPAERKAQRERDEKIVAELQRQIDEKESAQ